MRNTVLFLALLLVLCGCSTASNMVREVSGWMGPNKKGTTINARDDDAPLPQGAPRDVVTAEDLPATQTVTPTPTPRAAMVAILLPLSGKDAALGKHFLDAAQMAVLDLGSDTFELMPRDTGEDSASAQKAAEEVIKNGAGLIIGPVFSSAVMPVKIVAAGHHVPVLALSNDESVAGSGAYILGFRPAEQIQRMADYAASKGINNMALLAPASAYGTLVAQTLQDSAVHLALTHNYQNNKESIKKAVTAVLAQRSTFQGIFIADGGTGLASVAAALQEAGVSAKDMPIMGTGLWDDAKLAQRPALHGAWFAAPAMTKARASFNARFEKNYGYKPVRLASLAYDAVALAAVIARQGGGYDDTTLTSRKGFTGLDGIFRLNKNGTTEHGLAIMEVTPAGPRVIDKEPAAF